MGVFDPVPGTLTIGGKRSSGTTRHGDRSIAQTRCCIAERIQSAQLAGGNLKQIQDAKMEEIKEMIALLIQIGFVDCGRYIFQRRTKNANLIVAIRADAVEVSHGSPTVDYTYGYISTNNLPALERTIAVATLAQLQTDGVHTMELGYGEIMMLIGAVNHMANSVKNKNLQAELSLLAGKLMSQSTSQHEPDNQKETL